MSKEPGLIIGPWPGVVHSYDKNSRTCMVSVPGITDGGDSLLRAEIRYPVGDKSKTGTNSTDILMLTGDEVWLEFIGGDPRYPLITGQRNPEVGNGTDWRRFHQANIELLAQQVINLIAGGVITIKSDALVHVIAPKVVIDAPETETTGNLTVKGGLSVAGGGGKGSKINGNFEIVGDTLTHNGKNVGGNHKHKENDAGGDTDGPH